MGVSCHHVPTDACILHCNCGQRLSIYSMLMSFSLLMYLLSTGYLVRYLLDMNAQEQVELVRGASREVVSAAEALTPQV